MIADATSANARSRVHPTALVEPGVVLGDHSAVWDNAHIRGPGTSIGCECIVGEKSYVAPAVTIGDRVKINAFVYVCTGVTIEDGVMLAAGVTFTNDRYPRATTPDLTELRSSDPTADTLPTTVRRGATIGARAVIGPGLELGRFCMVAMGAVVTRSVPDFHLVAGQPARTIAAVGREGHPIARTVDGCLPDLDAVACPRTGLRYRIVDQVVTELDPTGLMATSAVIGAGVLGLAIAHRLRANGDDVTVFEAAPVLGGLASAWQLGDVVWDRHYHVTLASDAHTRAMLRAIGLEDELRWVRTLSGFYAGPDVGLRPFSTGLDVLRLPMLRPLDKVRLGATILAGAHERDGRRMEEIPVREWLTRWSGPVAFERFWLPLLRSKLGDEWSHASAAFIWATIQRLYAARRSGLKVEQFGYVPGGYARIFDRLAEHLAAAGVKINGGVPVRSVRRARDGLEVQLVDGSAMFDSVVVTTASTLAADVCPDLTPGEHERLRSVRYMGVICASLLLPRSLSPYYLTYLTDPASPFTAVVEMTSFVDPAEVDGWTLVYLPKYVAPDDPLFEADDAQVRDLFLAYLQAMHPHVRPADVAAFRVSRVRRVFAVPTLRYSQAMPSTTTSVPGLQLIGSADLPFATLNVNDTLSLVGALQ